MCLYRVDAVDYAANLAQNAFRMAVFNELYGEESPKTANLPLRRSLVSRQNRLEERRDHP